MPVKLKDKITADLLAVDGKWFDSHPPLFQRIGALKKAAIPGAMKINGRPQLLFRDYDEMRKLATISLYQSALGSKLMPEHLVPTTSVIKPKPLQPATDL